MFAFFKRIKISSTFNDDHVRGLFDLPDGTDVSAITSNLNNATPQLDNILGQGNWWNTIVNRFPDPAVRKQFLEDITGNPTLAAELKGNEGLVGAWEVLHEVSSVLRKNIPTLNFFSRLDGSPALQTKLLNDLDDVAKTKFVDDFSDAPDAALAKLNNDLAIVDDWNITKSISPVAGGLSPLPKRGSSKNVNLNSSGDPATPADWDNFYENEAGDILAQKGYDIEQSPSASGRTDIEPPYFNPTPTSNPDFKINRDNSLFFDAFSPRSGTNVRNVHDRAVQKLRSGQAKSFVINLGQWEGSLDDLLKQFRHWPEPGMRQVIIIDAYKNVLNILQ